MRSLLGVALLFAACSEPDDDYAGTLELHNCSGALVRLSTSKPGDKALAMTNGHCLQDIELLGAGEVLVERESGRTMDLLRGDGGARIGTVYSSAIVYATMTDTDLAVYRLTERYAEIEGAHGIRALTISAQAPVAGEDSRG